MHQQYANTMLFVRVYAATGLPELLGAQDVYCKLYVGKDNMTNGSKRSLFDRIASFTNKENEEEDEEHDDECCRIQFHTSLARYPSLSNPMWNEKFHVPNVNALAELLTIRVKAKRSLVVGTMTTVLATCVVPLHSLRVNHVMDQWFPLFHPKTKASTGKLRLQVLLSPPDAHQDLGLQFMQSEKRINGMKKTNADRSGLDQRLSMPYATVADMQWVVEQQEPEGNRVSTSDSRIDEDLSALDRQSHTAGRLEMAESEASVTESRYSDTWWFQQDANTRSVTL